MQPLLTNPRRSSPKTVLPHAVLALCISVTGCADLRVAATTRPTSNGVTVRPTPLPGLSGKTPKVVFIGDSITNIWGTGQEGDEFAQHPNWIAKGIVGQNSNQILARFQTDVIDQHPDVVHILAGTNDIYPGWTLGPSEVAAVFLNAIDSPANIKAMVAMAQAANIKVILATIPPWNCADQSVCHLATTADNTSSRYDRIDTWNSWIRQLAFDNNLTLVDYHAALVSTDTEDYVTAYTIDGVHPSVDGYKTMTPLAEAAIVSAWHVVE
jgi:lysophospholipase L1-like esterase